MKHTKKHTKKQSGSGLRDKFRQIRNSLKNRFRKKQPQQPQPQLPPTNDVKKSPNSVSKLMKNTKKSNVLDILFSKLCKRKLNNYRSKTGNEKNSEKRGISIKLVIIFIQKYLIQLIIKIV
jgi:hypothetical protein